MFLTDGGKTVRKALEPTGEPFRPEMEDYKNAKELGTYDMWQLHLERSNLMKEYLDQWNSHNGLDALLGPTIPFTAPEHGKFRYVGFTGVFNVLDYSTVSFPSGVYADKEKDAYTNDYKSTSEVCAQIQEECKSLLDHARKLERANDHLNRQSGCGSRHASQFTIDRQEVGRGKGPDDDAESVRSHNKIVPKAR